MANQKPTENQSQPTPRKVWIKKRMCELSKSIYDTIQNETFNTEINDWIDELVDLLDDYQKS